MQQQDQRRDQPEVGRELESRVIMMTMGFFKFKRRRKFKGLPAAKHQILCLSLLFYLTCLLLLLKQIEQVACQLDKVPRSISHPETEVAVSLELGNEEEEEEKVAQCTNMSRLNNCTITTQLTGRQRITGSKDVQSSGRRSRRSYAPAAEVGGSVWDFSGSSGQHYHSATGLELANWPTSGQRPPAQQQPQLFAGLAPKFALEPPPLIEYSNSTGAVIGCRPAIDATSGSSFAVAGNRRSPQMAAPVAISWRQVRRLAGSQVAEDDEPEVEGERPVEKSNDEEGEEDWTPLDSAADQSLIRLRSVRPDGSLVIYPFRSQDFRRQVHQATYRCCLSNRFGQLCSRPIRARAVVDGPLQLEVFDELVLPGNGALLKCHAPAAGARHLEPVGWLKDDRNLPIGSTLRRQQAQAAAASAKQRGRAAASGSYATSGSGSQQWKYLTLDQSGELLIRNASKSDAANYKCRARNRLTNQLITSKIGGQLMVDDTNTKSAIRSTGLQPLIWAREHAPVYICARFQSLPAAQLTWFWQPDPAGEQQLPAARIPVQGNSELGSTGSGAQQPSSEPSADFRLLAQNSCLHIQQTQLSHSGYFSCEATLAAGTGSPQQRSTQRTRLVVASTQLNVQLQVAQLPPRGLATGSSLAQQQLRTGALMSGQSQWQPQVMPLGATLQLNCSISGQPFDTVSWFKDSRLLAAWSLATNRTWILSSSSSVPGNSIKLVQSTVIIIEGFALKDRGLYQCQAYSTRRPREVARSLLLEDRAAPESSTSVSGSSTTTSQWLRETEQTMDRDLARSASSALQLELALSKPTISGRASFQAQTLDRGSSLSLQCTAHALPAPKILWFLDNQLIVGQRSPMESDTTISGSAHLSDDELQTDHLEQDAAGAFDLDTGAGSRMEPISDARFRLGTYQIQAGSSGADAPLVVSHLNVSQVSGTETGHYKCVASNPLGSVQHSAQVNVISSGSGPRIELRHYQASNVSLIAGRTAQLQCPLIGYPLARVDWFRGDERLPRSHRQRVEPIKAAGGGQLELSNIDKLNAGLYSCRASLAPPPEGGQQQAGGTDDLVGQLSVSVRTAPMIDAQSLPEVVQATEGQRTKLVCSVVQGDRPVEIRWLRRSSGARAGSTSGRQTPGGGDLELMQNSAVQSRAGSSEQQEDSVTIHNLEDSCLLTFREIAYADSADYLCLASNEAGQTMRWTRVIVNVAPNWSAEPPAEQSVLLGSRLQLDCLAHGFPAPLVTWKRRRLQPAATGSSSEGRQQEAAASAELQAATLATDDYAELVQNYRQRAYPNGSLVIDQVDQADGGLYLCEVANGIGAGLSKATRLRVNVPPYFRPVPVSPSKAASGGSATSAGLNSVTQSAVQLAQLNGRAELRCVAHGDQPMVIGWRREQAEVIDLVHDQRHRLITELRLSGQSHESLLVIQSALRNDSGQYICIASNEFGTEETRFQLLVQEPPEAPVLMRPIRASSRQATLALSVPYAGNSPIRRYSILFKQVPMHQTLALPLAASTSELSSGSIGRDAAGWQQVVVDAPPMSPHTGIGSGQFSSLELDTSGNDTQAAAMRLAGEDSTEQDHNTAHQAQQLVSLNLCCLQPYSRYLVRVRAINDVGQSEPSKAVPLITDEEAIGGPPLDVSVEATGAHSLKLRWRPPARHLQNGLIRGYYIGYRATGLAASSSPGHNLLSPTLMMQRVASGSGQLQPQADSSGALLEGGDSQFQYKNVQLDLSLPANSFAGSSSQQELIFGSNASSGAAMQLPQVYSSYLTNLRRKTTYLVMVQAYNNKGTGPRSDQVTVSTLDAAPPMSPLLRLVSVSHNSALLTWSGRRFNPHRAGGGADNSTGSGSTPLGAAASLAEEEEAAAATAEDDDDPQAYYTLHFRTEEPLRRGQEAGGGSESSAAALSVAASLATSDGWQQRRLPKRQPLPYVLQNLRCGSQHAAYMTATNSLGQSEPGDLVRFATMGAAPAAPSTARDFLQVNASSLVMHLGAWQGSGCSISSYLIKYRQSGSMKWTVIEHQLHPTVQTVTHSGSPVFSLSKSTQANGFPALDQNHQQLQQQQGQTSGSDFVLRNLLAGASYRLLVEANSEAGNTLAEYEFETGNYTCSLVGVHTNGIVAEAQIGGESQPPSSGYSFGRESGDGGGLDFSYDPTGAHQKQSSQQQRYTLGVWSLTALFVVTSVLMAGLALVLGLRSLWRLKPAPGDPHAAGCPSNLLLCCLSSRHSSGGSTSGGRGDGGCGADSNSHHSGSSGAGTCYQLPCEPLSLLEQSAGGGGYCPAGSVQLGPAGATPTLQRHARALANDMLHVANDSAVPSSRQMVSSSSLTTMGGVGGTLHRGHHLIGGAGSGGLPNARLTHTLGRQSLLAAAQSGGGSAAIRNQLLLQCGDLQMTPQQIDAGQLRALAQYSATLGKQYNQRQQHYGLDDTSGQVYGRSVAQQQQNLQQQFQQAPMSSSGTTSGYESSSMRGANGSDELNGVDNYPESAYHPHSIYPPQPASVQQEINYHEMNLYGQTSGFGPRTMSSFQPPNQQQMNHSAQLNGGEYAKANYQTGEQQQQQMDIDISQQNDYGMLFGARANNLNQVKGDQYEQSMKQQHPATSHHHQEQQQNGINECSTYH